VNGKNLFDRKVLRTALKILDTELHPDHVLPDASPEYRKGLAEALFYKVTPILLQLFLFQFSQDFINYEISYSSCP
jgi:hypothetical protein